MPIRKDTCRNFIRGSCSYGDKCKFLHDTQQQPKHNAFGIGSQTASQQQKPNPFGFGVQNSGPTGGSSRGFGQPNSQKPFENKWTRSEQPQNQSQAATHKCTDPNSCKRQIAEDFQQESPLWKLTCYGHFKYFPCDITGDISYEELRAVAYNDAKRGTSLQSIVERERALVKSKKSEFENLLKNPYTKNSLPAQPNQTLFPAASTSSASPTPQNSGFSSFTSLNQQSTSPNLSFGVRPSAPSNNAFGQFQGPGSFGGNGITSGSFGTQVSAQPGGTVPAANISGFGYSGMSSQGNFGTQVPVQSGGSFAASKSGFGNSGMSGQGSLFPAQAGGNTFTPNAMGFGNVGMNSQGPQVPFQTGGAPVTSNLGGFGNSGINNSQGSQLPSTSSVSNHTQTPAVNNSTSLFNGFGGASGPQQTIDNNLPEISAADASIWLKQEWKLGEIPEQPPPEAYVR